MFGISINILAVIVAVGWALFIAVVSFPLHLMHEGAGIWSHRVWGAGMCKILGIRVRIEGRENLTGSRSLVLAPNHASVADIFVMASLPYNFRWISKIEVGYIPFIGWTLWAMGTYFVRRNRRSNDVLVVMRKVEQGLKDGKSVLMFPEGTRTRTGELLPFKKGPFKVAQNTGYSICPIGIIGTYDIAPAGQIPRKWGHDVRVRIGKPYSIRREISLDVARAEFRVKLEALLAG